MAAKEIIVKKYVVRLSDDERDQLAKLIRKGSGPAQRLLKARILLKADISAAGDGWSNSKIIAALARDQRLDGLPGPHVVLPHVILLPGASPRMLPVARRIADFS